LNSSFWTAKKVLITGHTGFKGAWLSLILHSMGARVFGLSLKPLTTPSLYSLATKGIFEDEVMLDLREKQHVEKYLGNINPDVIFHLAAQASVLEGYKDPNNTWTSNVVGTLNLLEGISRLKSQLTLVIATTDKVYANSNDGKYFIESDPLGGSDPYSSSKVGVEELVVSYRKVFKLGGNKIRIAVGRAGNVIGGGDFLPDRILPDALKAIESKTFLLLRNPNSIRPWQHVFDPLSGYILLAEKLSQGDDPHLEGAFNFSNSDNSNISVAQLLEYIPSDFGLRVRVADSESKYEEAKSLNLNSAKAGRILNWNPKIKIREAVNLTFEWNRAFIEKKDMGRVSKSQIENFLSNED
jgi:CDP-glucose 4,6-dehydratase